LPLRCFSLSLTFEVDSFEERRLLARRQIPPGTDGKTGQTEWTDADAPESLDRDADGVHDVPHQMVGAFVDHHLEDEPLGRSPQDPELLRNHAVPVDHHAVPDPLQDHVARTRQRQDVVLLVELVARVHDPVGDVAVVGQQQQTLGVAIEAAHWVDALRDLDDVHHRAAVPLVLGRRDVTARFVEDQVPRTLRPEELAVDSDLGTRRVGLGAELRHDLAVDGDSSGSNQRLCRSARGDAARGENAL
jgi:hypothetical protein